MSSSSESGQQSGFGEEGLRWTKALTLGEEMLDRDEVGGLVDILPLRARFLGGERDRDAGGSSFFWWCLKEFDVIVEPAEEEIDVVVCADVGNGMTLISLGFVVVVVVDLVLDLVFFNNETGPCGEGTATNKPSWRVVSTCITFSGLQAET